ncbi:MAG: class I SAM-dependent methyltransferase [Bacteroidota bacterium]|nr:class I SAM-dependent methyltransferase [Bacteroidota bacterium]MDP4217159.1 class I SAM-dependent methyltransferase [Bacteroidota bacterium]MDP4244427.1 class I SAM-dependent methyltransferase [Bacteroidota bacterium]MDP4256218.1 class I SAM-dependent methyltransferase [Bacteroidota bacterium]MDP4260365.1 class I SAM-dependent methyltransferase [Bacteroidota bacterium]
MDHQQLSRMPFEDYLSPRFDLDNIDRFYVRSSIYAALKAAVPHLSGTLLDVGCGKMPYKSVLMRPQGRTEKYLGLDLDIPVTEGYAAARPDLLWDGKTIPLADASVDSVMLTEVLEHCFDPSAVLKETSRVLRKDGFVFITVPFLWPLHDVPYDEYRYTPFSLEKHLAGAGYGNIRISALGGWNASLGQMLALWLNRSGLPDRRRRWLYRLFLKRVISGLYKRDRKPTNFLDNTYMITGLTALAQKS